MPAHVSVASRFRELRKWDLGPIGAVLLVALLVVVGYAVLVGGAQGDGQEKQIRSYYVSSPGGGAPPELAKLINVRDCDRVGPPGEYFVVKCELEYGGQTFSSCFEFENDRLVTDDQDTATDPECEKSAVWSRDADSLVSR
jgi:hypothetical protein